MTDNNDEIKNLFHLILYKLLIFIPLLPANFHAQLSPNTIDSLLIVKNEQLRNKIPIHQLIAWNKNIARKCIAKQYTKGEILAYTNIANALWVEQKYKESLFFLQRAEKKAENLQDNYTKGKINIEYAQVYHYMGLSDIAYKYSKISIIYFKKAPINIQKRALAYAYGCKAVYLYGLKQEDSALVNLKTAIKIRPNPLDISNIAYHYSQISYNKDSADFYFKKAFLLLKKPLFINNHHQHAVVLMYYSHYKILQNKYSEALSNLEKAKFYAKKSNNSVLLLKIYESYYEIYKKKHDAINEQKYLIQYLELKDSIEVANKYGIKKSLQNLINKNAETKKALINKNIYLKILSFFTICIVVLFIYYHKKTVAVWKKMEQRLLFKRNKIKTLEKQNNSSFEEIINLAKKNHPNFYTRFQEIYPDFQRKILEINPTLQNSELVLLAYIYLNFETKEIADYLFKSPKTIQNRKHNLRKKLQMSSSEDIYVWLKKL